MSSIQFIQRFFDAKQAAREIAALNAVIQKLQLKNSELETKSLEQAAEIKRLKDRLHSYTSNEPRSFEPDVV